MPYYASIALCPTNETIELMGVRIKEIERPGFDPPTLGAVGDDEDRYTTMPHGPNILNQMTELKDQM